MRFSIEGNVNKNTKVENGDSCDSKESDPSKSFGQDMKRDIMEFGPRTSAEKKDLQDVLQKVLSNKNN